MKLSMLKWQLLQVQNNPLYKTIGFLLVVFLLSAPASFAQVLFTYGNHKVDKNEFLKAYNKNHTDIASTGLGVEDYLELYTRFKLKVQAARDAGMDTMAEQRAELRSFRYQLAENYIREDVSINLLVEEAFQRSLKDIHLSHIFLPVNRDAPADSVEAAQAEINNVYARLQKGESFDKVAASYQHGSLGYITAFVLPYNFESLAYNIKTGGYSAPFQNQSGFHILRKDDERQAVGKMRAAQILLAFTPEMTEQGKLKLAQRADSIYQALKAGADFSEMAKQFSDDHLTFYAGGEMPAFGVGQYDTVFENAAFRLEKDADISRPVLTNFGYHIIKRLQRVPVERDPSNKEWKEVIRERVLQSDRMQVAHDKLIENIRGIIGKDANTEEMSSDSAVLEYYRNNLERYNQEFADQLNEFREGNLLFAIMQKKVWDAAAEDSAGLKSFFEKNRDRYQWENSADALIVTSLVADSLPGVQEAIKTDYHNWRQLVEKYNSLIQVDSSRFDLGQIPVIERTNFTEGLLTAPVVNQPDSSLTFAYIIKLYPGKSPKTYAEARGTVINDYQTYLENAWIAELKNKYPVKVNRKVLKQVLSPRQK